MEDAQTSVYPGSLQTENVIAFESADPAEFVAVIHAVKSPYPNVPAERLNAPVIFPL